MSVFFFFIGVIAFFIQVIITFIARIFVERLLRLKKALLNKRGFKWDVIKAAQEYIELLKKRKMTRKENVAN